MNKYPFYRNPTEEEIKFVLSSKNERTKKTRLNKLFGISTTNTNLLTPMAYVEKYYPDNNEIKCGFCGHIKKFEHFDYVFEDNMFYIANIKYKNTLKVCNRGKEVNCPSLKLNPNSKEYVKIAYECETLEEATEIIIRKRSCFMFKMPLFFCLSTISYRVVKI
jgi:hypothetical protein